MVSLPLPKALAGARFERRPNRFVVEAKLDRGESVRAHLPDPGRLTELLVPGRRIWLRPATGSEVPRRTTAWSVVLVRSESGGLVSVDTGLPNRLVGMALERQALEELKGWRLQRREAPLGRHRFDFLLRSDRGEFLYLEVKSVTLVQDGLGLFPDAVTVRGARHLRALAGLVREGAARAAVLFLAQREDLEAVAAAKEIDPRFAVTLEDAAAAGVSLLARRCRVSRRMITLDDAVEVLAPDAVAARVPL